jgi:hypothetical protein
MTPVRKAALQWFHDQGTVFPPLSRKQPEWLTERMFRQMLRHGEVEIFVGGWSLTDKGRRALHGDDK